MQGTRDVRGSFYWTLTFGHTLAWPQLLGAPFTGHLAMGLIPHTGWHTSITTQYITRAPGTALQISLDAWFAATWFFAHSWA